MFDCCEYYQLKYNLCSTNYQLKQNLCSPNDIIHTVIKISPTTISDVTFSGTSHEVGEKKRNSCVLTGCFSDYNVGFTMYYRKET